MKRILILGATGSIGTSTIDVVKARPDDFAVVAVAALRSRERCEAAAAELGAKAYCGEDAALRAVEENDADVCLLATTGVSGLRPAMAGVSSVSTSTASRPTMGGCATIRGRGMMALPRVNSPWTKFPAVE
jgi:1-deoxy-D-xylulose-5-phosphate reductoisomerase